MLKRMVSAMAALVCISCTLSAPQPSAAIPAPEAGQARAVQPAAAPQCATNQPGSVSSNERTRIMVNEAPYFPFGMYHVSWAGTDAQRMTALEATAAAGFNLIHPSIDQNDDPFLQRAQELGVHVIVEFNQNPSDVIAAHCDQAAIIGWNIADDVDNGRFTAEEVLAMHTSTKLADPTRFTYISGFMRNELSTFQSTADVIAIQAYPIGNGNLTLAYVADVVGHIKRSIPDRPVIANLQTFAWPGKRAPTTGEVRNMTYQALVLDVDGIIYYTFFDSFWLLTDDNELWLGMQQIANEISTLMPALLHGTYTVVATDNPHVLAATWTIDHKAYLVLVNTSAYRAQTIHVDLPAGMFGEPALLFETPPPNLRVEGTVLRGVIEHSQAHVYELSLCPNAAKAALPPSTHPTSVAHLTPLPGCHTPNEVVQLFLPLYKQP